MWIGTASRMFLNNIQRGCPQSQEGMRTRKRFQTQPGKGAHLIFRQGHASAVPIKQHLFMRCFFNTHLNIFTYAKLSLL